MNKCSACTYNIIQKNAQGFNLDAFELLVDPIAAPFDKLRDLRLQDDD